MDPIHPNAVVTHHHILILWIGQLRPHPFFFKKKKRTPCYCLYASTVSRSSLIDQSIRIKCIKSTMTILQNVHFLGVVEITSYWRYTGMP